MTYSQDAKRLRNFPEYVFSHLEKEVRKIENRSGRKVLNFGSGNPDVKPYAHYIDKYAEFIHEENAHLYPGFGAIDEFVNGITHWYSSRFHVVLSQDELFPLLGAKDGVSHIPLALLDARDEILVPDPGYPGFSGPAMMIGAKPVYYHLKESRDFNIDFQELERLVTEKTKYIWVNFPSNPTGQVITLTDLQYIVAFARKHKIYIIYDNAYSEITFDGYLAPSILEIKGAKDVAVEIGSFSKTFSFAGFRMGWIVGNTNIIKALSKVKSQLDSGLSIPLQKLGGYVLTHYSEKWHKEMIKIYESRRNTIASYMKSLNLRFVLPRGGLYLWARIPNNEKNSEEFCRKILENKQILITPGTAFGESGSRYVRISICTNILNINNYF
jgi:aspartate/methionine/tyrosine aminotransferase